MIVKWNGANNRRIFEDIQVSRLCQIGGVNAMSSSADSHFDVVVWTKFNSKELSHAKTKLRKRSLEEMVFPPIVNLWQERMCS